MGGCCQPQHLPVEDPNPHNTLSMRGRMETPQQQQHQLSSGTSSHTDSDEDAVPVVAVDDAGHSGGVGGDVDAEAHTHLCDTRREIHPSMVLHACGGSIVLGVMHPSLLGTCVLMCLFLYVCECLYVHMCVCGCVYVCLCAHMHVCL